MDPLSAAALAATISGGLGAIGQGSANRAQRKAQKPVIKFQEKRNALIDQLLSSLDGGGKFGDLFKSDEAAFQKSFVEPAQSMFRNQIAPQIQQQAIAGGMQRSSGLDDQLLRAGVDLDSILNQQYMAFQQQGQQNQLGTINSILGAPAPQQFQAPTSVMNPFLQAGQGFLASKAFSNSFGGSDGNNNKNIGFQGTQAQANMLKGNSADLFAASSSPRKGFGVG